MLRLVTCAALCGFTLPIVVAMAAGHMVVIAQIDRMFDRKAVSRPTASASIPTNRRPAR